MPHRQQRSEELLQIALCGKLLRFYWGLLGNAQATIDWLLDVGGPGVSRRAKLRAADELTGARPADASLGATAWVTPAVLRPATGWFLQLELPADLRQLWGGAPLLLRRPLVIRLASHYREALYSFALDCLSGISETESASAVGRISSDELRFVLELLAESGAGAVDVRILSASDSRDVFIRIRQQAKAARPATQKTRLVMAACDAFLEMIEDNRRALAAASGGLRVGGV